MMNPGHLRSDRAAFRLGRAFRGLLILALLLLAGCETLNSRLARNQGLLQTLPAQHQALIQQGRIEVGFTPTEVYLAWGAPSRKAITKNAGGSSETWYYTATQSETFYQEERYYDWEYGVWRRFERPFSRYREYLTQEAVFTNGTLSSFTLYPSAAPFPNNRSRP
jgi:hypothetical protein